MLISLIVALTLIYLFYEAPKRATPSTSNITFLVLVDGVSYVYLSDPVSLASTPTLRSEVSSSYFVPLETGFPSGSTPGFYSVGTSCDMSSSAVTRSIRFSPLFFLKNTSDRTVTGLLPYKHQILADAFSIANISYNLGQMPTPSVLSLTPLWDICTSFPPPLYH